MLKYFYNETILIKPNIYGYENTLVPYEIICLESFLLRFVISGP